VHEIQLVPPQQRSVGAHDDLVLSLALACWWLRRGRGKGGEFGVFSFNPYSGVVGSALTK